jgi:glycosyltransferase involved in cell wall biosynthesis
VPRRLLLLNTDLERGGTPTVVRELAKRLRNPPNVQVEVACLGTWGPIADEIQAAAIHVTALGAHEPTDLWVARRLIDLIHHRRIDTVLSFLLHANAIAALAKIACRDVRFFQSIQTTQPYPAWHWHVQRFAHHAAEKIIVPSPSVARAANQWAKVPSTKIVTIPNAVDPADFPPSPIPAANPRPYPIGFLGRLDPIKKVPDLLSAVALLGDLVHLHIFGEGPERQRIEQMIHTLNLHARITMHGSVPAPQAALSQIGLLVLPSISEGMPMVLIEAMAAGVPVVGRDVPGVRDLITDAHNGLLAKSPHVSALAQAIEQLVQGSALRANMISQARRFVQDHFTWQTVLPQYRRVLSIQ